jgi:hypothetical protein
MASIAGSRSFEERFEQLTVTDENETSHQPKTMLKSKVQTSLHFVT